MCENLGATIKCTREKNGFSKTKLAKIIHKSPQLICDIEAGRKNPSLQTLISIVKILDMSLDDIFLN